MPANATEASYDAEFTHDPQADLPYRRDFTPWLNGAVLVSATWTIEDATLLTKHSETSDTTSAEVWLTGTGLTGRTRVRCHFEASDGRKDDRTWVLVLAHK